MLERIDQIDAGSDLTAVTEELLAPYEEELQQAGPCPGGDAGPPRTPSPRRAPA